MVHIKLQLCCTAMLSLFALQCKPPHCLHLQHQMTWLTPSMQQSPIFVICQIWLILYDQEMSKAILCRGLPFFSTVWLCRLLCCIDSSSCTGRANMSEAKAVFSIGAIPREFLKKKCIAVTCLWDAIESKSKSTNLEHAGHNPIIWWSLLISQLLDRGSLH